MGEKALVEGQIADAMELVKQMDAKQQSPTFAAWYFYSDAEEWSFLMAGPVFDALLPKSEQHAYKIIAQSLSDAGVSPLFIADVKLVTTMSSLPVAVGFIVNTPPDKLIRAHFTDNYVNGIFLKEMFVLRSVKSTAVPVG